ncbi:MAG TPA: DNA polymerase II large subunit [Archaeoglobaceae archaeon]|nr:DNA polymerase II large subunit [Archaeoglobaceae archaeon]
MLITLDRFFQVGDERSSGEGEQLEIVLNREINQYHQKLVEECEKVYKIAEKARSRFLDPSPEVEIPVAKNMAERVERLLGIKGISERIQQLEDEGLSREKICFEIAKEIVEGKLGKYDRVNAIELAVRSSVAILTEGVVAAPIEGIAKIKIDRNGEGEFVRLYYAGPIRSAGGTAQVISVLVGDYVRRMFRLKRYRPSELEILRYIEEIPLYKKVANLQYLPDDSEIRLIVSNCPVCIDGEPTEDAEVSGYRNIPGIDSNRVRGGMALVIAEGIALKAPKLKKLVNELGIDGWDWLDSLISKGKGEKKEGKKDEFKLKPLDKYLHDIVAGRPVLSHPSRKGGFRLRYGRSRNSGFATVGLNPATMIVLSEFIAVGSQLKIERPGKAGGVVPITSIEGPIVRLTSGDVVRINDVKDALTYRKDIDKILDLGEILINYGDFLENNHPLIPSSYVYEWWIQEVKNLPEKDYRHINEDTALKLCDEYDIPLHPDHTYLWHDVTVGEIEYLREYISEHGKVEGKYGKSTLIFDNDPRAKEILEKLLVEHKIRDGRLVLEKWKILVRCLGLNTDLKKVTIFNGETNPLELVKRLSGLDIRAKALVRIGARMGRPEKARERKMSPPPHVLFPVGHTGGKTRDIKNSINYTSSYNAVRGEYITEVPFRICKKCNKETMWLRCDCRGITEMVYYCNKCHIKTEEEFCPKCGRETTGYKRRKINIREIYDKALKNLDLRDSPKTIKGVIGLTSKNKVPEKLEKGILRAFHSVYVFKDGTIRYDMTDLPLTHFRPSEIGVSVEKLKELGYSIDWKGNELKNENQIVELKPQDIILAKDSAKYLLRVSHFIDDLLEKFYGMDRFYNAQKEEDLIGHLIIGLAPHTSAGVLGRIIGFSDVLAGYAHPYFHAAKRRNCFGGEETIPVYDGENWSIVKIGEFVDKLIKEGSYERTEFGDIVVKNGKYSTISYVNGEWKVMKISAFSKHPSPSHLIKITGKDGRTIVTTGDHPFPEFSRNGLSKVGASNVKELVSPERIVINEKDLEFLDILSLGIENIMIKGASDYLAGEIKKRGGFSAVAKKLGISKSTLWNYEKRDSIPKDVFDKLQIKIPENAYVTAKGDSVRIPRFLKVDRDFLRLIGIYIAEGYARKEDRSYYQIALTSSRNKNIVRELVKNVFKIEPIGKEVLTLVSRIIYELFVKLGCGQTAHEKRIPTVFLSLPLEKIRYLLQGYFTGDGSVNKASTLEVNCTSVNRMLLRDIEFLLSRFGIRTAWNSDLRKVKSGVVARFYSKKGENKDNVSYKLRMYGSDAKKFCENIGFLGEKQVKAERLIEKWREGYRRYNAHNGCRKIKVTSKEYIPSNGHVYSLTVESHNVLISNTLAFQCDGDEDCVMLLLDGLLNFSKHYLPDKRGGKMDAPLVLTAVVDPGEVDHEVHNMDTVESYPLEFYESTLKYRNPKELTDVIERIEDRLHTERRYFGLKFTQDTDSISAGVRESAYKSLSKMQDKVYAQMELAEKIAAVDEHDVAERVINTHFLPDIIGNLRAFSRQEFRCVNCDEKYHKIPLQGKCIKCNGRITLSVHGGSIKKYLEISKHLVECYNINEYTKQRLRLIDFEIQSLFESDVRRQVKISEFF